MTSSRVFHYVTIMQYAASRLYICRYFTVMGRRPVVIINYVKYSATYDIVPVGLLWRWMLYNKKISFSFFAIVKYTRNSVQTVSLNKHIKTCLLVALLFLFPAHGRHKYTEPKL